jgi:hypothetical protein
MSLATIPLQGKESGYQRCDCGVPLEEAVFSYRVISYESYLDSNNCFNAIGTKLSCPSKEGWVEGEKVVEHVIEV